MKNLPEAELKDLARDIHRGLVFTDRHIKSEDEGFLGMVFTIIGLMDKKQMDRMQKDSPGMVYEYLSKAGSRSMNGYPIFMSMNMLSMEDTEKALGILRKLEESENRILSKE